MSYDKGLPKKLWVEAANTTIVGYGSISTAYRIYLLKSNEVIISRLSNSLSQKREDDNKIEFQKKNNDIDDEL